VIVTLRIDDELVGKVDEVAERERRSRSNVIVGWIEEKCRESASPTKLSGNSPMVSTTASTGTEKVRVEKKVVESAVPPTGSSVKLGKIERGLAKGQDSPARETPQRGTSTTVKASPRVAVAKSEVPCNRCSGTTVPWGSGVRRCLKCQSNQEE
jgi:hypothetical protein